MKLKSIEIQGFKSFADRTKLEFNYPITAVVGPNGSGKSNISDAVRWVLGEQSSKTLRGAKMEDVIFGGTQARKAQGFASVTLTIDNRQRIVDMDSDEVNITRKLYRSGDSEYRINQSMVRLKDVHGLLMDTGLGRDGYSIIGQGKIAEIVSAKSKERREIFEEAAGIAKYRYQKSEAERRLTATEDNLARLKDILMELEQRIEPLRKESIKAKEFVELSNEKKTLEISLWINTINNSKGLIKEQEDKITLCKGDYDRLIATIDQIEAEINDMFLQMQNCSVEMESKRLEIKELEEKSASGNSSIAVMKNTLEHNKTSIAQLEKDRDLSLGDRDKIKDIITKSIEQLEINNKALEDYIQEKADKKDSSTHINNKLLEINKDLEVLKVRRAEYHNKINETKLQGATSSTILEQSTSRLQEIDSQHNLFEENLQGLSDEVANCNGLITHIDESVTQLNNTKEGYNYKLSSRMDSYNNILAKEKDIRDSISGKEQRAKLLKDMEDAMEGFNYSVKFIHKASASGQIKGILGTVSSVISTKQEYSLAIETALGAAMQNIIVSSEQSAKDAINKLRQAKAGRATFLPLTSVKGKIINEQGIEDHYGFVGIASKLVTYDEKYSGIISSLLGRIIVVEDLDEGTSIAKSYGYRYRVVTLDGQVINAGGSFTGGSQIQSAGVLSRRSEIDALKADSRKLAEDLKTLGDDVERATAEINGLQASIKAIDSQLLTASEDRFAAMAQLKIAQSAYSEAINNQKKAQEEKEILTKRLQELTQQSSSVTQLITTLENELATCGEEIKSLEDNGKEIVDSYAQLQNHLTKIDMDIALVQKDKEQLETTIAQHTSQIDNQQSRARELGERIDNLNKSSEEIILDIERLENQLVGTKSEIETLSKQISDSQARRYQYEEKATSLRNSTKGYMDQREQFSSTLARLEEKKNSLQGEYDSIISKLWDEYELTRTMAEEIAQPVENPTEANGKLATLRSKIRALGNVNVGAIEEFQEVNGRYTFLKVQLDDVESSKNKLQKLIEELTAQMQSIFKEQFAAINSNFSKIFVELFGGGKASLTLTEPDNVLESGIDIFVQPPGKLIKSLQSLSGGEQAFVAIAIYFSILHVNPSPFCLLDEIEAALDDVNVSKYARYLRKMSDKTQFITITHRRGTMEEADTLYGVTMQEEGISKLLELNVTELESKLDFKKDIK